MVYGVVDEFWFQMRRITVNKYMQENGKDTK